MRGKGRSKRRRALMAFLGAMTDSGVVRARRRKREAALEGLTWQEKVRLRETGAARREARRGEDGADTRQEGGRADG